MSESTVFYSLKAERPGGGFYNFADLKGKTVLIVNVASKWYVIAMHARYSNSKGQNKSAFTQQYKGIYFFQTDNYVLIFWVLQDSNSCMTNTKTVVWRSSAFLAISLEVRNPPGILISKNFVPATTALHFL